MFRKGVQNMARKCYEYKAVYNMAKATTRKEIKSTIRVLDNKLSSGLNRMASKNPLMKLSRAEVKTMQRTAVVSLSVVGAHVIGLISGLNSLAVAEEDDDGGGT